MLSKLIESDIPEYFNGIYSPNSIALFNLAKGVIITCALRRENWEEPEKNLERYTLFKKTEERLRNVIKKLSAIDEIALFSFKAA